MLPKKHLIDIVKKESGTDVSDTTATESDVLYGKVFHKADGSAATGSIPTYAGSKNVTPTEQAQTLATDGKYLDDDITVGAIPSNYKDTTGTDAVAGDMLSGKKAVTGAGLVTGSVQTYAGSSTVTQNGTLATAGKYVESDIEVAVPSQTPTLITKQITANGTYNAQDDSADGYSSVEVSVAAVSKLPQVVDRSVTRIDAADLAGVTKIGERAFAQCISLSSIEIPSSVEEISPYAFQNCSALKEIILPSSITDIKSSAFSLCNFNKITILATTPPTLANSYVFNTGVPKYIPNGTLTAYQTATNWSAYANDYIELPA